MTENYNTQQAQYNLYDSLMSIYDSHTMEREDRHNQIPVILAVIAITLSDVGKVNEIMEKFGRSPFETVVGPWATWVLEQFGIDPPTRVTETRSISPTNVADIETKIIE